MALCRLALVAAICSCVDGEEVVPPEEPPNVEESAIVSSEDAPPPAEDDICGLLPDDGPCALACDDAALAEQYVPEGTCAAFACVLTDGRRIIVHACHP
jgi:hypothetical protein